jgi:phage head maturation protease
MKLTTPMTITAADSNERTISGRIVAFEEPANASTGKVVFAKGSIQPKNVLLNLEHDRTRRIGKPLAVALAADSMSIDATFKVVNTTAGNDALIEASEGLRDGFSIELAVDNYEMQKDGTMRVLAGELTGVALVSEPAVRSARVSEVAAEEAEEISESAPDAEETPTTQTEGDEVDTTVTDASAVETVEATKSVTASAAVGGFTATPRSPIISGATFLEHVVKASRGDEDSKIYVKAANDTTTTNPAFNPVEYINQFVTNTRAFGRPTIDACGGATAHRFMGKTISVPALGTAPTVAATDEGAAPSETGMTSSYLTGTAIKYSGENTYSVELFDLNPSPTFYDELWAEMFAAYSKATNAGVIAAITAGGTQAATTAATSAGIISFVSTEAPAAYFGSGYFAQSYVGGASQWSLLMGATDTTGRPIYNAGSPMNSGGRATPTTARGDVLGLDFYVDRSMVATTIDESAFIIVPEAIGIYEQAPVTVDVQLISTGEIQLGIRGYMATVIKQASGLRRFNLA